MAENDFTASTPEELAEQFPITNRPFAVWYNDDPACDSRKWVVNDESGCAAKEFKNMATALKTAAKIGKEWGIEARKQEQALAEVSGADRPNIIQHIEEFCITMDAYFDFAMGEIEKHNDSDFDGLRFLTEAAKTKLLNFNSGVYAMRESTMPRNNTTAEGRAGAMACMDALRIIDRIAASDKVEMTWEECWQNEDTSIRAMQHAAGNHGEFIAGFVSVFAEYAYMNISGGEPSLYVWKPTVCMTEEEVKNKRVMAEKFANDCEI